MSTLERHRSVEFPHPMAVDPNWLRCQAPMMWWGDDGGAAEPLCDRIEIINGVAVVPLAGMVLKNGRFWWMSNRVPVVDCNETGIELTRLAHRQDIKAIVLNCDSGGGEAPVSLADTIFKLRQLKPIVSVVNEFAASAMCWIASSASEVVIPPGGAIGSIGVYTMHVDYSAMEAEIGIKTTVTFAGKYKAIHERPLTGELAAYQQGIVDELYRQFIEAVARNRNTTPQDVLDRMADARVFIGQQAVDAGLCDRLGTLAELVDELASPRLFFGSANYGQRAEVGSGRHYARRIVSRRVD